MKNKKILKNNATIIYDSNLKLNSIKISIFFRTGTYYETHQNYGISHLVEHMFFRRLDQLSQKNIYKSTESIGAFFRGRTFRNFVCFDMTVVPEYFKQAIDVILMILHPFEWTEQEVSDEKKVVLRQIKNKSESFIEYQERLYFNHDKYSIPVMGTEEIIQTIDTCAINKWKKRYFTCDNSCIVLTGAFQESDLQYTINLLEQIENKGCLFRNKPIHPKHLFMRSSIDDLIIPSNDKISDFWISFDIGENVGYTEAAIIGNMLCRGDGSRLAYLLKDQEALTDYVDSVVSLYDGFANIIMTFSVDNCDLERCLQLITQELTGLKKGVSSDDFCSTIPFLLKTLLNCKTIQIILILIMDGVILF